VILLEAGKGIFQVLAAHVMHFAGYLVEDVLFEPFGLQTKLFGDAVGVSDARCRQLHALVDELLDLGLVVFALALQEFKLLLNEAVLR
jgi:hypothetical protein